MSTHLERHRAQLATQAFPAVTSYITQHSEYAISANQSGSEGNTNYVIFGERDQQPVIFKYFCEDERKEREVYALRHFGATGIVPDLLDEVDARLIVQSRIAGSWLPNPTDPTYHTVNPVQAGYSLGEATAILMNVPLSTEAAHAYQSRFYDGVALESYFRNILDTSWLIHQRVAPYGEPLFAQSLASIEANLPYILRQKRVLYHQDAMNMYFLHSRFTGFFDLEMCRVGTEATQIGSLWYFFAVHNNWNSFAQGYSKITRCELTEEDFSAAQAFAHFLVWRYISRSGRWRGDHSNTENLAKEEADVAAFAHSIKLNNRVNFNFTSEG